MPPAALVPTPSVTENNLIITPPATIVSDVAGNTATLSSDEESEVDEVEDKRVIRSMQRNAAVGALQRNSSDSNLVGQITDVSGRRSRATSTSHIVQRVP